MEPSVSECQQAARYVRIRALRMSFALFAAGLTIIPSIATAEVILAKFQGASFSVPSELGTFTYSLPGGATIGRAILFSPAFAYPASPASDFTGLQIDIDGVGALSFGLEVEGGTFFLGSELPPDFYSLLQDGSATLSIFCWVGPCPISYELTDEAGTMDWTLFIEFTAPFRIVDIDIKPGKMPNSVNRRSQGKIPVAILSESTFYAPSEMNLKSLTFGRIGDEASLEKCNPAGEDVNADGLLDLVCHFRTPATGFQSGDTQGVLMGETIGGIKVKGADSVRVLK